jgi:hypothetical protein
MRFLKSGLIALTMILLWATFASAQTSTISGTVYDPSGAVIGGVEVTALNEATRVELKQASNEVGLYTFPAILVGTYTVTVELPGFKTAKVTGIKLDQGVAFTQNFTLQLGQVGDTVSVESETLAVNTTSATLGNVIEHTEITALPLNGRNPLNLAVTEPGVVLSGSTTINVNGMRDQSGNVTIDGIEANEASNPTPLNNVFRVNPDNVQEFKVTTSNPTAEEGRNAGINVSMATRSGGNDFHGSLVEYFRNSVLNANEFYANAQGNKRPPMRANQYGFDVSGPIRRGKTFFYGAWQGQKVNLALAIDKAFGSIPRLYTPTALSGTFRYWVADPANPFKINGTTITANSPLLVKPDGSLADGVRNCTSATDKACVQSYNIYGNDPLKLGGDPQVLNLLKSYPLPNNYGSGDGLNQAGYLWNSPFQVRGPRNTVRIDHVFNNNNSMFARVLWAEEDQLQGDPLNSRPAIYPGQPPRGEVYRPAQNWAVSFRTVLNSTMVNEFTAGFARFKFYFTYIDSNPNGTSLPRFTLNNADVAYVNAPHSIRWLNTPQVIDNFSWTKGAHQLKFGGNVRFYGQNNQNGGGANNTIPSISLSSSNQTFDPAFNLPKLATSSAAGISSADNTRLLNSITDLLGMPAQITARFLSNLNTDTFTPPTTSNGYFSVWATGERLKQFNGYAQDEWRMRKNFNLTYGVRWEWNKPATESSQPVFVPNAPISGSQGLVTFVRANSWWNRNNLGAFAPRLGFSWNPFGEKTVIRAGYGISIDAVTTFFATDAADSIPAVNYACVATTYGVAPTSGCSGVPSNTRLSQGFPTSLPAPTVKPSAFLSPPPQTYSTAPATAAIDPNLKQATVHQWNLSIQRDLPGKMTMQIAYVGNRGTRLVSNIDVNQVNSAPLIPQFLTMQANANKGCNPDGTGCPTGVTGQSIPLVTSGLLSASFVNSATTKTDLSQNAVGNFSGRAEQQTTALGLRPNQQFGTIAYLSNANDSVYHSLQATIRRRFSNGLLFQSAYVWSKVIDDQSQNPVGTGSTPTPGGGGLIDSNNLRSNRGRANWDRTHVWTTTWVYELPFGRGHHWLANSSKAVNGVLGGWNVQGFNALFTGTPYSISSGVKTAFFTANSRAVLAPGVTSLPDSSLKTKSGVPGPVFFNDASSFAFAPVGSTGMGRNVYTGPKFWDVDGSISKDFNVTERVKTTFKLEMFNALNHANFRSLADATTGSTSILSTNFGTACCQTRPVATSTAIVSNGEAYRVVQAVLKIGW